MIAYELLERRTGFREKSDAAEYLRTHGFQSFRWGGVFLKFEEAATLYPGLTQTDPPPANSMVWAYPMDNFLGLIEARVTHGKGITEYWSHVYEHKVPEVVQPAIPRSRAIRIK